MKYMILQLVRSHTSRRGKSLHLMLDQNTHDMHILESWEFSPMHYCWEGIHIWMLHAMRWCHSWVRCTFGSMQLEGSASISWASKQSMNKTTHVASVRMGDFNFPAQISLCTALSFTVVCQYCCRGGGSSQGALLWVCPVFVNWGRFRQQTKQPFNHRCGLKRKAQQQVHNVWVAAGPHLIFLMVENIVNRFWAEQGKLNL